MMTEEENPIMNTLPLVTVVCTVYNQATFILETLCSISQQTYPSIELIVIDNHSSDNSVNLIETYLQIHFPNASLLTNPSNKGLCYAFNQGLQRSKGKYIIDLSGDDVLLPERISQQVIFFERCSSSTAAIFSNAFYIDNTSRIIGIHHTDTKSVPSGAIFSAILKQYFICTPSLMFRSDTLKQLGGYDTNLSYEDFDITLRLSRHHLLHYQDQILVLKRLHQMSMSLQIIQPTNSLLPSTLIVCQKALQLCQTTQERQLVYRRIESFIRKSFYTEQFELVKAFALLIPPTCDLLSSTRLILVLSRFKLRINFIYQHFIFLKHRLK